MISPLHPALVTLARDLAKDRGAAVVLDAVAEAFGIIAAEVATDAEVRRQWEGAARKTHDLCCELAPIESWPVGGTVS